MQDSDRQFIALFPNFPLYPTLGGRGLIREEPRSGKKKREEERSEKTSGCPQQLIDLTAPIDLNQGHLSCLLIGETL